MTPTGGGARSLELLVFEVFGAEMFLLAEEGMVGILVLMILDVKVGG